MQYQVEERKLLNTIGSFFIEPQERTKLKNWMISLNLARDPDTELGRILNRLGELDVLLAGGAITSLFTGANINDLDLYMRDISRRDEIIDFLQLYFKEEFFVSNNCITFRRKGTGRKIWTVQLITRFSGAAEDIFKDFDFTITNGAYCFKDKQFTFGERFFTDLATRRLVYSGNSHYPICALFRTKKYQKRGYYLPGSTVMHIGLSIVRLEIKTYKELKDQLLGIDTMFLQNLLNSEKYNDSLPVDYGAFVADALEHLNVHTPEDDLDD